MKKLRGLSKSTVVRLAECFRRTLVPMPLQAETTPPRPTVGRWYWGKLTSDLAAPTDGMAAPTHATFDLWLPNGTSEPPGVPFVRSTETSQQGLTVYNRMTGLRGTTGTTIQVEFGWGEWTLKGADC